MRCVCLASSSAGNCYVLELDCGCRTSTVMVECGIPFKEVLSGMTANGMDINGVDACLITHGHKDHCLCAKEIERCGIPIYAHQNTLKTASVGHGEPINELKPTRIADKVYVLPFLVEHDIEGAMGFVIKTPIETILFVNDCKMWKANLSAFKFKYVFIECNYWEKQVYAQIGETKRIASSALYSERDRADARAKMRQFERNVNAHMSLAGCKRSLSKIDLSDCVAIFLMHLSDGYANEYEMKNQIQQHTGVRTYVCKKKGGIK